MAAGLGFKTFTTGEVLTAADTNGYLMQGVLVFASTAARDAAITSPQEGQFAFTKDTDQLWYRSASAWVASGATGDIEGVTAGIGISGGGTSGTVTVTNSMATAIDSKGDLVAGTGADTFARLGVGANNTVLTADSAEATGLKWATVGSGALTLIQRSTFSAVANTGTTFDSVFSTNYTNYYVVFDNIFNSASAIVRFNFRVAGSTQSGAAYRNTCLMNESMATTFSAPGGVTNGTFAEILAPVADTPFFSNAAINFFNVGNGSARPFYVGNWTTLNTPGAGITWGRYGTTIDADGFILTGASGNTSGTVSIYGLAKA